MCFLSIDLYLMCKKKVLKVKTNKTLKRAEDEIRTRDPQLGKLMLYQLSYFRLLIEVTKIVKSLLKFLKTITYLYR